MEKRERSRILIPLTIFSMFFGAGNLIFPPFLALEAGENFIPAFIGFAITAIGLPITALIAVERTDGLESLSSRVHPLFGRIYTVAIYLAIGPCLAIPRTASASFEMVMNATGADSSFFRILYSILFFALASLIAMRPEKLTKTLGRITCPLLLLLIAVLAAGCIRTGTGAVSFPATARYSASPLSSGLQDGYQTMEIEIIAGIIAGVLLLIVYLTIALMGKNAGSHGIMGANGAQILSSIAYLSYGNAGSMILALIFIAACLNTCTGLLSSCGEYFGKLFPGVNYRTLVVVFALFSAIVSNIGLTEIITMSSPVLSLMYPVAIILTIGALLPSRYSEWTLRIPAAVALLSSIIDLVIPGILPLSESGLGWIIPSVIALLIGCMMDHHKCKDM